MLNTRYSFHDKYTVVEVENLRLVYIMSENYQHIRDEQFDHAFILYSNVKPSIEWRRLKNVDRRRVTVKQVRRPSSYLNGCSLLLPSSIKMEREEVLVRIDDTHIARLFSYRAFGQLFVPHHLKDHLLSREEFFSKRMEVSTQPLIDVNTLHCPRSYSQEQIALL